MWLVSKDDVSFTLTLQLCHILRSYFHVPPTQAYTAPFKNNGAHPGKNDTLFHLFTGEFYRAQSNTSASFERLLLVLHPNRNIRSITLKLISVNDSLSVLCKCQVLTVKHIPVQHKSIHKNSVSAQYMYAYDLYGKSFVSFHLTTKI